MGGVCSFCRRANWWLLAGILGGPGPLGSIGRMSSSPCVSTIQHATPATSCWSISSISSSSSPSSYCHQNANNKNANPTHVLSHKSQGIPCNWSGTMNIKGLPISYPVHFEQTSHIIISLEVRRIFYIKCALWIQNNTKFFFSACLCSPTLTNPIKISIVTDTDTHQRNTFLRIFIYPRPDVCDCALGKSSKKRLVLVRLTVRADPPSRPLTVSFTWFFLGVNLTLDYDYTCSETDFTQEKSLFSSNY